MGGSIQAVVIGNNVYVGGGSAFPRNNIAENSATVMVYSLETENTATL